MDSLRRRVLARDRQNNTDRQLEVTSRDVATTLICIACRRVPDLMEARHAWAKKARGRTYAEWPGLNGVCPSCGGQLESITW